MTSRLTLELLFNSTVACREAVFYNNTAHVRHPAQIAAPNQDYMRMHCDCIRDSALLILPAGSSFVSGMSSTAAYHYVCIHTRQTT